MGNTEVLFTLKVELHPNREVLLMLLYPQTLVLLAFIFLREQVLFFGKYALALSAEVLLLPPATSWNGKPQEAAVPLSAEQHSSQICSEETKPLGVTASFPHGGSRDLITGEELARAKTALDLRIGTCLYTKLLFTSVFLGSLAESPLYPHPK